MDFRKGRQLISILKPPRIKISRVPSNMSVEPDPPVSEDPSAMKHLEAPYQRKVSVADTSHPHVYDNLAFESPRSRKISANSEHTEIGPVRKKSILHNAHNHESTSISGHSDSGKYINGDTRIKKHSVTDSIRSKRQHSETADDDRSWWYIFCLKCRAEESHPSWQPPLWRKICPHPFCPSYRQFSRIIALLLIGTITWCIMYAIIGDTVAPRGHLFQLILLCLCAHFGGWLISLTTLPALIGMLFTGLIFQNLGIVNIDDSFTHISKELRSIALVILLIRAGLDLDPEAFKRLKFTIIKIGVIPLMLEFLVAAILSHFLLDLPWDYSCALGAVVSAVSPAVVVPCLFRLRTKGYGVTKGIPTLIIAVAGIDDAVSVALFGLIKSIMFSDDSLVLQIIQGPVSILGGIGFGILWGIICNYTPEKHDPFVVPLRVLMLLTGGLISIFGSELIGYGGAGPLACVGCAFVCLYCWSKQGWEIEDNPAATAFQIFWMIFEPILFGITGAQIKFNELDGGIVAIALGILITGAVLRIICTIVVGIGCKLNLKEKIFVAFSCMAKATVQAALGPVVLSVVLEGTTEHEYGHKILMVCVLSIILTAPTAAILMTILGPRLLTRTKVPAVPEGWRRSHRPSIRDISIIDEEEFQNNETIEQSNESGVTHRDFSKGDP